MTTIWPPAGVHPSLAGKPLFPCNENKRPAIPEWRHFADRLPTTEEITSWKDHRGPWAMPCGPLSFVVLDFDGDEGEQLFEDRFADFDPLPPTARTPSGGYHAFFRYPTDPKVVRVLKNAVRIIPGVDIRCLGGYVVIPSGFNDGRAWVQDPSIPAPALPDWIVAALMDQSSPAPAPTDSAEADGLPPGVGKGKRNHTAAKLAGRYLAKGLSAEEAASILVRWDRKNSPPLGEKEIRSVAFSIARKESEKRQGTQITTVKASSVKRERLTWLWDRRIPEGKLTLFVGDPELGKSMILTTLASIISTGGTWPCGEKCSRPREVLLYSLEDDCGDTLVPRLIAAGANLDNIHFLKGITTPTGERGMNLQEDMERISKYLDDHPDIAMVGIDPLTAVLGKIDSYKYAEMRSVVSPVTEIFQKHKVALVGINHNTKTPGAKAIMRSVGSIALMAAARAAFAFGLDPADQSGNTKVMVPSKSNLAKKMPGFKYNIQGVFIPPDPDDPAQEPISTPRIVWGDSTTITADEALADREPETKLDLAKKTIIDALSDGPRKSDEVKGIVLGKGVGFITYKRARQELSSEQIIKGRKEPEVFDGEWYLTLLPKTLWESDAGYGT